MPTIESKVVKLKNGCEANLRPIQRSDIDDLRNHIAVVVEDGAGMSAVPGEIDLSNEALLRFLDDDRQLMLLALVNGDVVGNIDLKVRKRKRLAHTAVMAMSVHPEWRSQGVGSALLDQIIDWAEAHSSLERLCLDVLASNETAIGLYRKRGFVSEGSKDREIKYADGTYTDSLPMARPVGRDADTARGDGISLDGSHDDAASDYQPLSSSVEEVVSDLQFFFDENLPVEIWLNEEDYYTAFTVCIGSDFVLTARTWQFAWLNGFRAIRLSHIKEVLPTDDEEFLCRALKARGEDLPPASPFGQTATSLHDFLESLHDHFPIAIFNSIDHEGRHSDVAGTVLAIRQGVAELRRIATNGDWIPQTESLAIEQIVEVVFGSEYEKTLFKIAESKQT